jgi:hypothetical protein
MEADLATDERLPGVLAELRQQEPTFHRREHIGCRGDFERQTAEGVLGGRRQLGVRVVHPQDHSRIRADDDYVTGRWAVRSSYVMPRCTIWRSQALRRNTPPAADLRALAAGMASGTLAMALSARLAAVNT